MILFMSNFIEENDGLIDDVEKVAGIKFIDKLWCDDFLFNFWEALGKAPGLSEDWLCS